MILGLRRLLLLDMTWAGVEVEVALKGAELKRLRVIPTPPGVFSLASGILMLEMDRIMRL